MQGGWEKGQPCSARDLQDRFKPFIVYFCLLFFPKSPTTLLKMLFHVSSQPLWRSDWLLWLHFPAHSCQGTSNFCCELFLAGCCLAITVISATAELTSSCNCKSYIKGARTVKPRNLISLGLTFPRSPVKFNVRTHLSVQKIKVQTLVFSTYSLFWLHCIEAISSALYRITFLNTCSLLLVWGLWRCQF